MVLLSLYGKKTCPTKCMDFIFHSIEFFYAPKDKLEENPYIVRF